MKISHMVGLVLTVISANVHAQVTKATKPAPPGAKMTVVFRGELGKWWQNSEIAKKLQLNDGQISQLDQIFYEHKLKLIDYGAEMEKQDLKLQTLLDADVPNDGQVEAQVDQVLAARGKLEREFDEGQLFLFGFPVIQKDGRSPWVGFPQKPGNK